ncbi:MAG: molybdopterin-dependent oxidoreductase [Bacteroidetes bacterium]|nr:molybdopterin-dependent oxidoreductase [Bacteroidota bacterium]MDA1122331.1 molybdopterin-dependent oxidoreductase [Bacteroidota bacterium]
MKALIKEIDKPVSEDRRDFLKKLGCGIIVVFSVGNPLEGRTRKSVLEDFNAYIRIKENGRVDCFTGKIEMGQGVYTSLAQVLSEELDVSIERIDMVMGDTELCPYDAGTWGSLTTPFFDPLLREAASEAREVLIELAAEKLGVRKTQLKAENGIIYDARKRKLKISYTDLTKGEKIVRSVTESKLKKASEFKIIGKPILRQDAKMKVTGSAKYAGDILLPGMLHARIKRSTAYNAKLISIDTSSLSRIEGIEIVQDGDLFAVLHESPDVAEQAIVSVEAKWEIPEAKVNDETVFVHFKNSKPKTNEFESGGSLDDGKKASRIFVEKEYYDGYKAHASIETHTATAQYKDGKLTMWASTQTPFGTRKAVSDALGIPLEKVHIKQNFVGGGFGGKIYNQQAVEAAKIAKLSGKPVQLMWSRQEEFLLDKFRPASVVKIQSGLTGSGKITFWDYNILYGGDRGAKLFYDIPNYRCATSTKEGVHPLETGAWRAPSNSTNTFARETHIDIMATMANIDPVEFRLKNLTNIRVRRPLEAVADKFGWKPNKSLPNGSGWGVALGEDVNVYVAMMAEVEVNKLTGEVIVKRVVCSQDMGQVVNPEGAMLQIEGGVTMGLGYALSEDVKFRGGTVETLNFSNYEITRFSVTPQIETVFIDDMDSPPLGGGEPSIICVGAMVGNAIYNACGARLYQMPFTPQRVLEAMPKEDL